MKGCTKDCKDCFNCDAIHGFMCSCRYSYNYTDEDGQKWHCQCGHTGHRKEAEKCEFYTEKPYERDVFFALG